MKNLIIVLLLLTTLAGGALYLQQSKKVTAAQSGTAALEEKITELQANLEKQESRTETIREQLHAAQQDYALKASEVGRLEKAAADTAAHPAAGSSATATNSKPANPFAEMFKKPEMRDMIKKQQKGVFSQMIDKNYAQFFSALQMSPEQSTALKDLILKKQMVDMDAGMSMMSGDLDPEKRKELMDQSKLDRNAVSDEIKQFLGDDNYKEFQAFEKSQPDRQTVSGFKDQLASGANALTPDQEQQLVKLTGDTRQSFKFSTDFTDKEKFNGDFENYFTDEKIDKFVEETGQLNAQIRERASGILSAEQLAALEKFQADQREIQIAGMKMAKSMFGKGQGTPATPAK